MKICAIIAEYNPFHSGHAYQIHMARNHFDHVIVIMSGHFVQRGESACYDKWLRTKWALSAGASAVIELPACYALQSAQRFAAGAVRILNDLGIVDSLVFGSESNDLERLTGIAEMFAKESNEFKAVLKSGLKQGNSYILSRQYAAEKVLGTSAKEIIKSPNDILAIEYIRALRDLNSPIKPFPIKRTGADYSETQLDPGVSYASATSIRNALLADQTNRVAAHVPPFVYDDMVRMSENNSGFPVNPDRFSQIILSLLRRMEPDELSCYPDVSEGLEYRLKKAAAASRDLDGLLKQTATSRYTAARIRRIAFCVLLRITKELAFYDGPLYARMLGFSAQASELLTALKDSSGIPMIMKPAAFPKEHPSYPLFKADLRGTDLYAMVLGIDAYQGGRDYSEPLVIL